jgi:hypothetical protein
MARSGYLSRAMFGTRTVIGAGSCWLLLGLFVGCGGAVEHGGADEPTAGSAAGPSGGGTSAGGMKAVAGAVGVSGAGRGGALATGGTAGTVDPPPVTDGCPTQDLPPPRLDCDPLSGFNQCGDGAGCYPFVQHPGGSGCDAQIYGTVCQPAGVGTQGARCGDDTGDWCAPGHVCVIGERAGKRCAALCRLGVVNQCGGGLLCGDLDVSGFGVCG